MRMTDDMLGVAKISLTCTGFWTLFPVTHLQDKETILACYWKDNC